MKLAEALLLRGDLQKKLASLKDRINRNVLVQEGDQPAENPSDLIREASSVLLELESLITAIHKANLNHRLPDGRTLTEAMARRDSLIQKHSLLEGAVGATRKDPDRYSVREIKWVTMIEVNSLQKQIEDTARQIRELNAAIQETNWKISLD